jgi:hypothetical protein
MTFEVTGRTRAECEERAIAVVRNFAGADQFDLEYHFTPGVEAATFSEGAPQTINWRADVYVLFRHPGLYQ